MYQSTEQDTRDCVVIEWYWPFGSSGPEPCKWKVWVDVSASQRPGWIIVSLFGPS